MSLEGCNLPCITHIRAILERPSKAININKVSVNLVLLLAAYRNFVRTLLEFALASKSILSLLDHTQYSALRMILGCMRSTLVLVLSETNEPSLGLINPLVSTDLFWGMIPLFPNSRLFWENILVNSYGFRNPNYWYYWRNYGGLIIKYWINLYNHKNFCSPRDLNQLLATADWLRVAT